MKKSIASIYQSSFSTPPKETAEIFWENEVMANRLISGTMFICAYALLLCWLLNMLGILAIGKEFVLRIFLVGTAGLVIPAAVCGFFRGEKKWIKYLLLISVTLLLSYLDSILTFNVPLLIIMPVIFSCRYYSCRITVGTALLTTVLFSLSARFGAIINVNTPDLNFANEDMAVYLSDVMRLSFLPKWIIFDVLSAFCCVIAHYGRKMVLKQYEITQKTIRVETELELAAAIQRQALPDVTALTECSCRFFDLAASMDPAKEVGGDFYDFFYPDSTHLAMVIADVADKGIAASLFMMMSKTMLDSCISAELTPGDVLQKVNKQLYKNSTNGMFVTAWLGILDLKTGELVTANAGHEYPALKKKDGSFEMVKDKHGFVLGAFGTMRYPEHRMTLNEGDTLFVYSDGIPEANGGGEEFGTERMLESLNRHIGSGMRALIDGIKADISEFTGDAQQFDDMTMLAFQMGSPKEEKLK